MTTATIPEATLYFCTPRHGLLQGLLRALDIVISHAVQTQSGTKMRDVTVRELLESMFPEVLSDERLERVCSKPVVGDDIAERGHHHDERLLREEDQRDCLLSARVSVLPCLLHFIRTQLDAPDFSTLPLALKDRWTPTIELAMLDVPASFGEDLAAAAHELEASLGDYQEQLVSDPNAGLQAFLAVVFGTERALFEELPLMKHLPPGLAARNYVELRKKLRRWAAQTTSHAAPTEGWFWPFLNKTTAPSINASATSGEAWGRAMWFETPADLIDIRAASEARQAAAERTQAAELKARVHMMSWRIVMRMRSFVRSRRDKMSRRRDKMSRRLQHHARRLTRARRERVGSAERAARQDAAHQALVALGNAKGKATLSAALAEARSLQEHLQALSDGIPAYQRKLEEWEEQERAAKHVKRRRWLFIAGSVAALALAVVMPWHGGSALVVASSPGVGARAGESLSPSSRRLEQLTLVSKPTTTPASPLASSLPPSSNEQPDVSPTPELESGFEPDTALALGPSLPEEQVPPKRSETPSVDAQPAPPQGVIGVSSIAEAYEVAREKLHYARKLRDAGEITQEAYLYKERQIMSEF